MRTYADFAPRAPVPHRGDGIEVALRNAPSQVNVSVPREFTFFHADGEFVTMEDLVKGTLLGRNYGWLRGEEPKALAHIARVLREDHGKHPLAEEDAALAGISYAELLHGSAPGLPADLTLPEPYRIDVTKASDGEILDAVAKLIAFYVTDLAFVRDEEGYTSSPYDVFLRKNHLPLGPEAGESSEAYSHYLLELVEGLAGPIFVDESDGHFLSHTQRFEFGEMELEGLKVFLRTSDSPGQARSEGGIGNCAACHAAPHFTDFRFHNTGATQEEYDAIHGAGAFAHIEIPDLDHRAEFLDPARAINPFADVPTLEHPGHTDLGLWNVFLNPAMPRSQESLMTLVRQSHPGDSDSQALLDHTVAAFKTPGLRDLGHSDPYFHTGRFRDIESAVRFYRLTAEATRHHEIRNADAELGGVHLEQADEAKLVAFLRALNEDYE